MDWHAFIIRTLRLLLIWQLLFTASMAVSGVYGLPWPLALLGMVGSTIGCWATLNELANCKRAGDMPRELDF